jgi:hypothetical protein
MPWVCDLRLLYHRIALAADNVAVLSRPVSGRHAFRSGKLVYLPADSFPMDAGPESEYQP